MSKKWHQKTAATVRDAIRAREVSAAEVTQAYLGRIDEVDGKVQAYIDVWRDSALARAETIDIDLEAGKDRGPLAGVPVGLKDVLCTTEGTTGCCSKILKGFRSPFNATVVEKLLAAGVVPLGKNNMDEFAMGSSTEHSSRQITRN
ncbi:MAG: Asp-tRNA(Asn)/Glu-tRNA(Gln) amidotransferase GatCAB subunit A, partial [Candidatus Hydrogenedentes bacterium]|nr:Asp-tRNA(Asn)/Glu-tRNA(Gln) amidotransferase GatCAB subunit A [Candidatus Hydrogenedentota bacterium]